MSVTARVSRMARDAVARWPEQPNAKELNDLLRLMGRWRSQMLANTYMAHHGTKIHGGPFAGMEYVAAATEGALVPRLLGTYESELHPHFAAFLAEGIDCVIDVGCAEGYYAVGLARLAPEITVHAFDIDEKARRACAELAAKNGVAERVIIGGEFRPDGFEAFAGRRPLVLVDAEGAEVDILQPQLSPALARMNVIVETHDCYRAGAMQTMRERFSATHEIERVDLEPKPTKLPPWFDDLAHLDQLLAIWEWRLAPTPWLVMVPKSPA